MANQAQAQAQVPAAPFNLEHFVAAQDRDDIWAQAAAELRNGHKETHWMWFVFPQIAGLGGSSMSRRFAIASLAEARAYLAHPVLGPRLAVCTEQVLRSSSKTMAALFRGTEVDIGKLHASMTLFARAAPDAVERFFVFDQVLNKFFDGMEHRSTVARLNNPPPGNNGPANQGPANNPAV